jgi:ATP-dependent DNA helicase RecQ
MTDKLSTIDPIIETLRQYWGYDELRPLQREAIEASQAGRDSLVVLPTGGGKSICYQLPAALSGRTSVVVSPLISLMKDQIDGLTLVGFPAAALHGALADGQADEIERRALAGEYRLLYVAPERLLSGRFLRLLDRLEVGSISVDEAHCISHWGHDFRPEYRRVAQLRERFPAAAFHAYTATATQRVREDIAEQLGLRDPVVLVGDFDRPNLIYRIVPRVNLLDQVAEVLDRHRDEASIIYCISRKNTEDLAERLGTRGIKAEAYHAGLTPNRRRRLQDDFAQERLNVVTATVAFGMGIDRSDVRCVIHTALPKSLEAYQQETGRAGRDGLDAECVLFHSGADATRWARLIEESASEAGDPEAAAAPQLALLDDIKKYARQAKCRHRALVEHFGQTYERDDCNACDVCLKELLEVPDSTLVAQKIVSCVARLEQRFGAAHVAGVLRGRATQRIKDLGHERLTTFGLLAHESKDRLLSFMDQLIDAGLLARTAGDYPALTLTERSVGLLRSQSDARLYAAKAPEKSRVTGRGAQSEADWEGVDHGLFQKLRDLRRGIAQVNGVPAYVVFGDATLRDMARRKPTTPGELMQVKGVGPQKLQAFGEAFLGCVVGHRE